MCFSYSSVGFQLNSTLMHRIILDKLTQPAKQHFYRTDIHRIDLLSLQTQTLIIITIIITLFQRNQNYTLVSGSILKLIECVIEHSVQCKISVGRE